MSIGDLIRYIVVTLALLVAAIFGLKVWKNQKLEKEIVRELRVLNNPTSSFEQNYAEEAQSALFKSMAHLHRAESKLKKEPAEILEQVFHGKDEGALFGKKQTGRDAYADPRLALIRDGLLRNYQHSRTLGLFIETETVTSLEEGNIPDIMAGPAKGSRVTIRHVIDPEIAPGMEKIIPNMIISPPNLSTDDKPTDFEITQAKELASDLLSASLIERDAEKRIITHYEQVNAPPEPEPDPEPAPAPGTGNANVPDTEPSSPTEPDEEPEPEADPTGEAETEECPFDSPLPDS